jgi:hypothetical protein
MTKICRICGFPKELEDFHKKKGTPDGHRNECKECVKVINVKYKEGEENKLKRKLYDEKRYTENREDILKQKKKYHKENRDVINDKKRKYRKNKPEVYNIWRLNNLEYVSQSAAKYRLKYPYIVAWRSLLHNTLKRMGTEKSNHTIDMLGYSADELKEHITKLFTTGMSWENYGEWHIDHIKPVTLFDKSTPVNIVCALNNLQPLWATTRTIENIEYIGNLNKWKN